MVRNFIQSNWRGSRSSVLLPVLNPATGDCLTHTPLSTPEDVDAAVQAAGCAFAGWKRTPVADRIQPLFRLKQLLEEHLEEIARNITTECGVCAIIAPFNFPAMIPFWFLPYALASGNTVAVKPSERVPLTIGRVFELIEQVALPPGVVNLVNGGRTVAEALISHPVVRAVSFVGSSGAARAVYAQAAAAGKRVRNMACLFTSSGEAARQFRSAAEVGNVGISRRAMA